MTSPESKPNNSKVRSAWSPNTSRNPSRVRASGDDLPVWGDLQDVYRTAWIAAARAVLMDAAATIVPPPDEPDDEGDELPA